MGTDRSYIWCHQEPTRSAGTRQGIHDATSQRMCCGKWSALWTSYVILKRVSSHVGKLISRNLFTFGPMLIGTLLLIWGWWIHRKSLWHRFWDTLYISIVFLSESNLYRRRFPLIMSKSYICRYTCYEVLIIHTMLSRSKGDPSLTRAVSLY